MCSLNELLYLRKTNYCKYYALLVSVQTMVILFDSYEQLIVALIFFAQLTIRRVIRICVRTAGRAQHI